MKVVGFAIYLISWPINKKHDQLLFWYLFQVFIHKLEMYVKFPITAVPSLVITDLTQQFIDRFGERISPCKGPDK